MFPGHVQHGLVAPDGRPLKVGRGLVLGHKLWRVDPAVPGHIFVVPGGLVPRELHLVVHGLVLREIHFVSGMK